METVLFKIGNSHSQVTCNEVYQKLLSDELSYESPGAFFARKYRPMWDGRIQLMRKDGTFPTGLIKRACRFLKRESIPYNFEDLRSVPSECHTFKISEHWKPRDYQSLGLNTSDKISRGVYNVGTGGGKTFIAALIIGNKKVDTLYVTPDTGIREQTIQEFHDMFDGGLGLVSRDIKSYAPIVVANIQSLLRKDPKDFKRFRMLMTDEFHHSSAKSYLKLNKMSSEAYYRYGFTGTFIRSDGTDMTMHGVLSEIIFKKTTSELIEEGWLVRPYIKFIQYQTEGLSRHNYKQAYDAIVQDVGFNTIISNIAEQKIKENKQTLVLVRRREHGELLSRMVGDSIYLNGDDALSYREIIKEKFINKEIRCLIATEIFGEGKDIPSIDVLINARCQKTEIQTKQGIGRALRTYEGKDKAEVFDFYILGQKHLKDHSIERIKSYKSEPAFRVSIVSG